MKNYLRGRIALLVLISGVGALSGCGESVNKFSYSDRRTPQLLNASVKGSDPVAGGQKPKQVASSVNYKIRSARYAGAVPPMEATSSSFIVRTGVANAR